MRQKQPKKPKNDALVTDEDVKFLASIGMRFPTDVDELRDLARLLDDGTPETRAYFDAVLALVEAKGMKTAMRIERSVVKVHGDDFARRTAYIKLVLASAA